MISDANRRTARFQLDDRDILRFSDAVSASLQVVTRPQFFSWLQSSLHGLLPHDILVCGVRDTVGKPMALHHFASTRYFREPNFRAVADPQLGLVPLVLLIAQERRTTTIVCRPEEQPDSGADAGEGPSAALRRLVLEQELKNVAVQLVMGIGGHAEALYAFGRVGPVATDQIGGMVEILTPHLHQAFLRVLMNERTPADTAASPDAVVTRRQVQILNLVKSGKTNAEIAVVLGCSQWTVKNHVQSILRRLDSSTRTHAITRAISLGILSAD